MDAFDLSSRFHTLLLFDCPTQDNTSYLKFSEDLVHSNRDAVYLFLDTEVPTAFMKSVAAYNAKRGSSTNLL